MRRGQVAGLRIVLKANTASRHQVFSGRGPQGPSAVTNSRAVPAGYPADRLCAISLRRDVLFTPALAGRSYFTAIGATGAPTPPVNGSGGADSRNS